jgi:hypothetical protein
MPAFDHIWRLGPFFVRRFAIKASARKCLESAMNTPCISDTMNKFLLPAFAFLLSATPSLAIDANILRQLNRLSPQERIEQRCDIEAMEQVTKGSGGFNVDRVVSYTFGAPDVGEAAVKAPGAVFRSRSQWYRLSYKCKVNAETLAVKDFEFKVGDKVPKDDWSRYYLYD